MPAITRGHLCPHKIWIDNALCREARCRSPALRERRIAAIDIVAGQAVGLQANRISRIVRLGRCRDYWGRADRKNRQNLNAHGTSSGLAVAPTGVLLF